MINQILLNGCAPEPLLHYLKALGIFRLLAEDKQHGDPNVRSFWLGNTFALETVKTADEVARFFFEEYCPTPLVSPWNGGSGFYDGDDIAGRETIRRSDSERLKDYREVINEVLALPELPSVSHLTVQDLLGRVEQAIAEAKNKESKDVSDWIKTVSATNDALLSLDAITPQMRTVTELEQRKDDFASTDKTLTRNLSNALKPISKLRTIVKKFARAAGKDEIVRACRNGLNDRAVDWLDAALVLFENNNFVTESKEAPLLGVGGIDGKLEFARNFMARLTEVLPEFLKEKELAISRTNLRASLFSDCQPILDNAAVGQFHPAGAGGAPNASNNPKIKSGDGLVNPWDFILAIEGALLLASAAVRKLAPGARSMASFPFTTRNSTVGYGTATGNEKMRAEIWLPIWDRSASFAEIAHLFGEGRVRFNNKARQEVQTGFDFARAVAELGADRGIAAFQRYGFLERNGQANLAAPLGRFEVRERPRAALVHQLDRWLEAARRATGKKEAPPRLTRARAEVEEAIFSLCAHGQPEQLRDALIALGAAESEIAVSPRFRDDNQLRPLSGLSTKWAWECWDGSAEFEIAAALAAIHGGGKRGAFRTHLEPVEIKEKSDYFEWTKDDTGVVWRAGTLDDNLAAILHRRSIDALAASASHPQLQSSRVASLSAVNAFLNHETDDDKLEALLRGLSLINWMPRNGTGSGSDRVDSLLAQQQVNPVATAPGTEPQRQADPVATAPGTEPKAGATKIPPTLPRAYALLKLLFLPEGKLERDGQSLEIRHEPAIVPLLCASRVNEALTIAGRRLRSTGLTPFTFQLYFPDKDGSRLAAALLIPIHPEAVTALAEAVLRPSQTDA